MATIIITTDGLDSLRAYNGTVIAWLNSLTLRLFENNHTILVTDHAASVTEATFTGYASQAANDWTSSGLDGNNNWLFAFPDHVFTQTGTGTTDTVYGAYWTDGAGKMVLGVNAGSGFAMDTTGKTYTIHADPGFALGQLSGSP